MHYQMKPIHSTKSKLAYVWFDLRGCWSKADKMSEASKHMKTKEETVYLIQQAVCLRDLNLETFNCQISRIKTRSMIDHCWGTMKHLLELCIFRWLSSNRSQWQRFGFPLEQVQPSMLLDQQVLPSPLWELLRRCFRLSIPASSFPFLLVLG